MAVPPAPDVFTVVLKGTVTVKVSVVLAVISKVIPLRRVANVPTTPVIRTESPVL